jgi:hypothetical protein
LHQRRGARSDDTPGGTLGIGALTTGRTDGEVFIDVLPIGGVDLVVHVGRHQRVDVSAIFH